MSEFGFDPYEDAGRDERERADGCDCPPGMKHLPDCPLVTGKPKP